MRPATTLAFLVIAAFSPLSRAAKGQGTDTASGGTARFNRGLYFPDSGAESRERAALSARITSLERLLESADASALPGVLAAADATLIALQRHVAYWKVVTLENVDDRAAKNAFAAVEADQSALSAAIAARLQRVPDGEIASLGRFAPCALGPAGRTSIRLSPDADRYRSNVVARTEDAIADAYDRQREQLRRFPGVGSTDAAVRRPAILRRAAVYDTAEPVAATLLAALVDLEDRDAAALGFPNAAARKYASMGLSDAAVARTLAAVAAQAPAYRRYQQLVAERAAQRLGVSPVWSTERSIGLPPERPMPFAQARSLVLTALSPLGADYVRRFGAVLDPASGRLDLSGGAHRANTGTSIAAYDAPVGLYLSRYTGTLASLSTVVHEGGHAIHHELMNASSLPACYRSGPHSLYEGYAIFNELLLLEQAARSAPSAEARTHALEALLDKISLELFTSAMETAFERSLYEAASGGQLLSRERIDSLYRASIAPFAYWPMSDVGTSMSWMVKPLLFEDPLYLVNYLYASLVAVALFDKAHTDPEFSSKYHSLLARGFDADPTALLRSMGITLEDPALIQRAVALFAAKTDELEAAYNSKVPPTD